MTLNKHLVEGNPVFELWNFGLFCFFYIEILKLGRLGLSFRVVYFVKKKLVNLEIFTGPVD